MVHLLFKWQDLVGAFLGASAPFLLWWFAQKYEKGQARKEHLYYLARVLNDQVNTIIGVKKTIEAFLANQLSDLLTNIENNPEGVYSADYAFLPLFSVRPLDDKTHEHTTGSNYVDNKIDQSYNRSHDFPLGINDLRGQFIHTLEMNKEIAFNKLNSSESQKVLFKAQVAEFIKIVRRDIIETNIPLYLKTLIQTEVALKELARIGILKWSFRFDAKYRFYWNRKSFLMARNKSYENIEEFFRLDVEKQLKEILPK